MSYAIIGFGKIGQALAKTFARKGIDVSVATTRDPASFAAEAAAIGPEVIPTTLADAAKADVIFLAVRFEAYQNVAQALPDWHGKTIVDVTNAYGVSVEKLGGPSSAKVVAKAFTGGRLVKGFNHLGASVLAQDPAVHGGRRVVFLSSDDDAAVTEIGALAEDPGLRTHQARRIVGRWPACPGARRHVGPADLQGPSQVRLRPEGLSRSASIQTKERRDMMSTDENVQTVKDFFAAMGAYEKKALLALAADDIEWIIPGEGLAAGRHAPAGTRNWRTCFRRRPTKSR